MTRRGLDTTDRAEAEAFLHDLCSLRFDAPGSDRPFAMHTAVDPLADVNLVQVRLDASLALEAVDPIAGTVISTLQRGGVSIQVGRRDDRWRDGDLFVAVHAGDLWHCQVDEPDLESICIDPATFAAVAQTGTTEAVALTGVRPVSTRAEQLWRTTVVYAQHLAARPGLSSLVATSTARLLAATALATFANNARTDPTFGDRRDAHPVTVRRAVAFIEAHSHEPIGVDDIARAANVTPRTVQLAFRRHLDTTPMAYLRRVRLERAHADLQAGASSAQTVAGIAGRWGFAHAGRFAAQYSAAYVQRPSATLGEEQPPAQSESARSRSSSW